MYLKHSKSIYLANLILLISKMYTKLTKYSNCTNILFTKLPNTYKL